MPGWYARPVVAVRDTPVALQFYGERLGFGEDWRYEEAGRLRIVQVSRDGCEWPEDAGRARLFISLDGPDFEQLLSDARARGVEVTAGRWGYELAVVEDIDGNRLWFPKPSEPTEG